jgi:hypothetical protein
MFMNAIDLLGKLLQNNTLTSSMGKDMYGGTQGRGQQPQFPGGKDAGGRKTQSSLGDPNMDAMLDGVLDQVTGRRSAPTNQGRSMNDGPGSVWGSGQPSSRSAPPQDSGLGGLGDLLGSILGGGQASPRSAPSQGSGGGGLEDLLGSILGGGQPSPRSAPSQESGGGGLDDLLGSVLGGGKGHSGNAHAAPPSRPSTQQLTANDCAELMIRAMINAAKSDGRLDQNEQRSILEKFGQIGQEEQEFLRQELNAPLDVAGFTRSIPSEMARQIYAISVTAVEVDQQGEANYLGQLAQGLKLDPRWCNQVHDQLGAPRIFG